MHENSMLSKVFVHIPIDGPDDARYVPRNDHEYRFLTMNVCASLDLHTVFVVPVDLSA